MCEKCEGKGFTEENHGLLMIFCDCEIGKELLAKQRETYGYPEIPPCDSREYMERVKAAGQASRNLLDVERQVLPSKEVNDNSSGTGQPDTDTGSGDTGKPEKPKKRKAKRKAGKRAG